jgi:hypothetical protein
MVSPTNRMEIARCVRAESAEKDFEGITGLILNLSYFCSHVLYGPQRCPLVEAEEQIVIHGEDYWAHGSDYIKSINVESCTIGWQSCLVSRQCLGRIPCSMFT